MSQDEFVDKHFHLLYGMVCEALTWSSRGQADDLSRRMSMNAEKIKTLLRETYNVLKPPNRPAPETPPANPPRGNPPSNGPKPPGGR